MFAVLTVDLQAGRPLRQRTALFLRRAGGVTVGEDLFRTAMFCHGRVSLCEEWSEKRKQTRVKETLLQLRAKGARRIVLPPEWRPAAREAGMIPEEARPALEACGTQAVLEACRELGYPASETCLAVYGSHITPQASMQLLTLSKSLRTLRVYGEGNERLRAQLWRGCGIVDRGPMPEKAPVLALLLAGGRQPDAYPLTVDLSAGMGEGIGPFWTPGLILPCGAREKMPAGASETAFAAALLQAGALQAREIHVSRLDIPAATQYNKEIVENCL